MSSIYFEVELSRVVCRAFTSSIYFEVELSRVVCRVKAVEVELSK